MRKLRDVFYVKAYPEDNVIEYYGMEMEEFMRCSPIKPDKLLFLEARYSWADFHQHTGMEILEGDKINGLLQDDIYGYGDFCWVDYDKTEHLNALSPQEIAELLYLGHMFRPLDRPFFERIQNRYAYLAHDDGWFCRLYLKQFDDLKELIANKVVGMASTSKRRKIYPFPDALKERLAQLAQNGLLIDFGHMNRYKSVLEIHIYTIGEHSDMDSMYNNLQRHISRAAFSACLVHKRKQWAMEHIHERPDFPETIATP